MKELDAIHKTMDRRRFLQKMAGAGALIATTQLPSWGQEKHQTPADTASQKFTGQPGGAGTADALQSDRPEVFPERGDYERLALSYAIVRIGLERPFSVLHLSDSHLAAAYTHEDEKKQRLHLRRTQTFGGRQEEALRDALDWAKKHVEYVVHTGDLIDWQSEANFDLVRKYFGQSYIGAVGNHEFSPDMWLSEPKESRDEAWKDRTRARLQEVYPFDIRLHSQVAHGVNFVTLDNVFGTVTWEQVQRFREEVKKGLPIVLCMHVPFYDDNIWLVTRKMWTREGLLNETALKDGALPAPGGDYKAQLEDPVTRDFIASLKQEPLLKCILSGHAHLTFEEPFSPTCRQYLVAGGFLFTAREVLFL